MKTSPLTRVITAFVFLALGFFCAKGTTLQTVGVLSEPVDLPEHGEKGLRAIYNYLQQYRGENQGAYPKSIDDFYTMKAKESGNEKESDKEVSANLINPDTDVADSPAIRNGGENIIVYELFSGRPDGSSFSSPKVSNTSDIIASTGIYVHDYYNQRKVMNQWSGFSGVHLVLWDTGLIEAIPYDDVLYVFDGKYATLAYLGQAGIPPIHSLSYQEFWGRGDTPSDLTSSIGKPLVDDNEITDNGGPESTLHLFRRLNYPSLHGINRNVLWQTFNPAQPEFTLSQIQTGATKLGLNTQDKKQSLVQLQKSGTPALLFLQDDGRIVTLTALDDDRAVIIDRSLTQNVERSVLEKRYGGEALVPTKALTQNAAIVADDAVRELKLPSLDAEVSQQFVLRNTGATPITLQLEYPLLGVTESKLSKDVIAPGETATLDIKVKWRSILKAPYQNVLVSIQTNDPIVPRLQLAILLTPPQGAGK